MLRCCLRRSVEACYHKYFVVVSREKKNKYKIYMPRSGVAVCTWQSNRSQHVMKPDISGESRFLPTLPVLGGSHRNIAIMFGTEKLEWCGYPAVKFFFDNIFIRLVRIHERDGQMDRQTDTA